MSEPQAKPQAILIVHPLVVRVTHWINAFAMVCMLMSGWAIYNASPIFPFTFPVWATVGGWLGGSIAWHFAAMWLLCANGLLYLAYGLASGHLRRKLLPVHPREVARDAALALRFRLPHDTGRYNAVQRALYLLVLMLGVLLVASGLSIWKPVQFSWLTALFGGFDFARRVHFVAMAGVAGFVVVHLALVLLVPRTLPPMFTGRARRVSHAPREAQERTRA
ncbi:MULTISPECIES: cytochrome b/b6 domain-containing protein [Burkholderiaceae]|uniref:cytochrome b/b6 domain-containing protein n=1 Tax=Burkholderiaceae TaxID=119060 RepID=UPI0014239A59|nr:MULTISPECIES: cytochrome b/b6 domain-containing protein [Burkholderiaceae]MBN3847392.1 cytochrome b/b6 domain-containing protein [Paraburkholderia sp. Ac-20342]NIF56637.1 cytochrome b/b6 domain-containing protein [Burkholderia sp. Ax-1724]NIF79024.1 cytochrome b/b6 domain-containing protein [Paraburkholderia sp. Cy-641]